MCTIVCTIMLDIALGSTQRFAYYCCSCSEACTSLPTKCKIVQLTWIVQRVKAGQATREAQESQLVAQYRDALQHIHDRDFSAAADGLYRILRHDLMRQVRLPCIRDARDIHVSVDI